MTDAHDSCASCVFWSELTEAADKTRNGSCRRFPPQMMYDQDEGPLCSQPISESDDWCGEFVQALQS